MLSEIRLESISNAKIVQSSIIISVIYNDERTYSVRIVPYLILINHCNDNCNNMSKPLFFSELNLYQQLLQYTIKHHQQYWETRRHGSKHPPEKIQLLWHVPSHVYSLLWIKLNKTCTAIYNNGTYKLSIHNRKPPYITDYNVITWSLYWNK